MHSLIRFTLILLALSLFAPTTWAENPTLTSRVQIDREDISSIALNFDLTDLDKGSATVEGSPYALHTIPDEGIVYEYNKPILPAVSRWVIVPQTAGLRLEVTASTPRRERAKLPPVICTDPEMGVSAFVTRDAAGLFPPEIATMADPVVIRGVRMVLLTTHPVQFDPIANEFLYYDNIQAEVVFTDAEPVNPADTPERLNRSREFLNVLENLAINGPEVARDLDLRNHPQQHVGHYLLVIHPNLVQWVIPFVEWKRKSGWKVDIYSVAANDVSNSNTIFNNIKARYDAYKQAGVDPFDLVMPIGDRSTQDGCGAAIADQIAVPAGTTRWGSGGPHADYKYGLLEGNDDLPDVGVSRWFAGNQAMMELNVNKTLGYQATPRAENPQWMDRAGNFSTHWGNGETTAWHISINTNARWGVQALRRAGFKEITDYEDYSYDRTADRLHPFMRDLYNNGASITLTRAELYNWRSNLRDINANNVHPICIGSSGHGEWATWWLIRSGNGNDLRGPVAKTNGWGGPDTGPMSMIWLHMSRGVVLLDMSLGWARAFTYANVYTMYGNNLNIEYTRTDYDAYGDPGIKPWLGQPLTVTASFPQVVTPKTKTVEVVVTEQGNGRAVPGAQVTVYAPGNIPAAAQYAAYDGYKMWTTVADSQGRARFVFPDNNDFTANTDMHFTVTGRKIRPFFGKSTIKNQAAIELGGYQLNQVAGNGDGHINPGEIHRITLTATNVGAAAINGVSARVISLSRNVEAGDEVVNFGNIAAGQSANGDRHIQLDIGVSTPDAASRPVTKPNLLIEFSSGDTKWYSAVQLTCKAPNLEVKAVVGNGIIAQDDRPAELDVEIQNLGTVNSGDITATIKSLGFSIQVQNRTADYAAINVGQSKRITGNKFTLTANKEAVPGTFNDMVLILRDANGFIDSAFFKLQVGTSGAGKPSLPDKYGYIVFDDGDNAWDIAPKYRWIEISAKENNREYNGTSCGFDGQPDDPYRYNTGQTKVVPLGFKTQFYGEQFDTISICSNGFISMGNQQKIFNWVNWPMDQAVAGGVGMIAPFWDKLKLDPANAQVYYYHDRDSARFIVEWYKLRHFTGGNTDLIFQCILYDRDVWVTETGDTKILFQYKSIANQSNVGGGGGGTSSDHQWVNDNPYASVGISAPDGSTGLNYTFANVYPATNAAIQNNRALLFVTTPKVKLGVVYGLVVDVATNQPIEGATVYTTHGQEAKTDANGYYRFGEAVAEFSFDIKARAKGYNEFAVLDTLVPEEDSIRVDFALTHPLFSTQIRHFKPWIDPDMEIDYNINIANPGNGPLEWRLTRKLPGNADADPWQRRESIRIGETLQAARVQGVVFGDGKYIVACGAKVANDPNMIYVFNKDMELVTSYAQFGVSRLGMYDLGWDGSLVWGADNNTVYGFTIEGEVKKQFNVPIDYIRGVEWDSKRNQLLLCGRTTSAPLIGVDREGRLVNDYGTVRLNRAGIGFWPDDPDGFQTYLFSDRENEMVVHKMNLDTKDTVFVTTLKTPEGGLPEGCFITNQYDVYSWVFISLINGTDINDRYPDRIDLWQLEARRDWFRVYARGENESEIRSGIIPAGEDQDLTLVVTSKDLPLVPFEGLLQFSHNAITQLDTILVSLTIVGPGGSSPFNVLQPADDDTVDFKESTEVEFAWNSSVDRNWGDQVSYELWMSYGETQAKIHETADTSAVIDFAQLDYERLNLILPPDELVETKWWILALSDPDTTLSDSVHTLFVHTRVQPDDPLETGEDQLPVVFGLAGVYPSPFNAVTTIRYGVDRAERIRISAFDISGRKVAVLANNRHQVGWHRVSWNAIGLPSGIYFIRLEAEGRVQAVKIALIK